MPTLNAYLRRKFDNEKIRVVTRPKKTNSLEAYLGEEFLGVLFLENEKGRKSYIFELPILDVDLVDVRHATLAVRMQPRDQPVDAGRRRSANRSASRAESAW